MNKFLEYDIHLDQVWYDDHFRIWHIRRIIPLTGELVIEDDLGERIRVVHNAGGFMINHDTPCWLERPLTDEEWTKWRKSKRKKNAQPG